MYELKYIFLVIITFLNLSISQKIFSQNAGTDQIICASEYTLQADASVGQWTVTSGIGTFDDPTLYNTHMSGIGPDENVYRWTLDAGGAWDEVAITNNQVFTFAGSDEEVCLSSTTLNGNIPDMGAIGTWTIVSGGGAFTSSTFYNTTVVGLSQGDNIIRWTNTKTICTNYDDVIITNNQATAIITNTNFSIIATSATINAQDPTIGFGLWTVQTGGAIISNPSLYTTEVTNLAQGVNTFRWTVTNQTCSDFAELIITNTATNRQQDSLALVALYNSTNGASWVDKTNWLTGNLDTWFGVEMMGGDRVLELNLSLNNLVGTLPTEIGDLTSLTDLNLEGNTLSGTIPSEIGNLSSILTLGFMNNQLSGTIPSEIGNLTSLTSISFEFNNFSGLIPFEIGSLTNLQYLTLSENDLSGPIPIELGSLISLKSLGLSNNDLSGLIPNEIGSLTNLQTLNLSNNDLSGSIPVSIGGITNLWFLLLSDNELTGSIPTEISNLSNLKQLIISSNQLGGTIPSSLGSLANLQILKLNDNELIGTIPNELGDLNSLTQLDLSNNQLTGIIPSDIGDISGLTNLNLSNNKLTGSIPENLGNLLSLIYLYLDNNNLSGGLPEEITDISGLTYFKINDNNISYLPDLVTLSNLYSFYSQNNKLTFEDLETNYNIASTTNSYIPQQQQGDTTYINQNYGTTFTADATIDGAPCIYQWFKDDVLMEGETTATLTIDNIDASDNGKYTCELTNETVTGLTINIAPVYLNLYDAGINEAICSNSYTLNATPSEGVWSIISGAGDFTNPSLYNTEVSNMATGDNIYRWTLNVNSAYDEVTITNNSVHAFAGNDTTIYYITHPIPATNLELNADAVISPAVGTWTTSSIGAWFDNSLLPNTTINNLSAGFNRLTWSVTNAFCSEEDDILVFTSNNFINDGTGEWNNPSTWTPVAVPTQWDSVTINSGNVDITGYEGFCRRLRIGTGGVLTVGEDAGYTGGELHSGEVWVEQEVEKNGKGIARLNIKHGGMVWVEQEVEKGILGKGVVIGSGGELFIEQEVEKDNKANPAQLTIKAGKSMFVSATQLESSNPNANVYIKDGGYLFIEQEVEKEGKAFSKPHGLYIGSGGAVWVEQEVEKGKALSGLKISNGGSLFIEQEVEKANKSISSAKLNVRGGMVWVEQEVEKDNNILGALYVKNGGVLDAQPNATGVESLIDVPRLKILGGTVNIGTPSSKNKTAKGRVSTGMLFIEQEVEKAEKETTQPNLTIEANGELNFINLPFEEQQNAYIELQDGASFTLMPSSNIITESSTFASVFMEDGASFIDGTEGAGVPGEVIVEQNLIPGAKLISTPVNGFMNTAFEHSDIFQWNEANFVWDEITTAEPLNVSQGYELITNTLDTIAYIGDFSYGTQSFDLTGNQANTNVNTRGWNLAGNPYTSAIDWEQISLTGIENTVYTYDDVNENFGVYQQGGIMLNNANNLISTATGMYLKTLADVSDATLYLDAKSKVHEIKGLYSKYGSKDFLEAIKLSVTGDSKKDEILLRFEETASSNFESNKDAFKLFSLNTDVPQIYTKTQNDELLCIDVRKFPVFGTTSVVPLNFRSGTSGTYSINADSINLNINYSVVLKDLLNNVETDLRANPNYAFSYTSGSIEERFELIFNKTVGLEEISKEDANVKIYSSGNKIFVILKNIEGKSQVRIYSITGQKLLNKQISGSDINIYTLQNAEGIYFVKVISEKGVYTDSVFLTE